MVRLLMRRPIVVRRDLARRRSSLVVPLLAMTLVGPVVVGRGGLTTLAQVSTPSADENAPPEGVTFTPLGFGTATHLPATPVNFALFRVSLDPGASLPVDASNPSASLLYVVASTLTFRAEAPITVTRAATIAAFSTPGVDASSVPMQEKIAAGTAFTMTVGDSAVFPGNIDGDVRNEGQEQAVALLANIEPEGSGAVGTPAP